MTTLVDISDLAAWLDRDVAALNSAKAELFLDLASGLVRDALGQTIDYVQNDDVDLIGPGSSVILLPELPVWDVTLVEETRGTTTTELVEGRDYRLELGQDGRVGIIRRLPRPTAQWCNRDPVRVIYSHGYRTLYGSGAVDELPATLKTIVLESVARGYGNPTGKKQETIGRYSYTDSSSTEKAGVFLTAADLHDLGPFFPGQRTGTHA